MWGGQEKDFGCYWQDQPVAQEPARRASMDKRFYFFCIIIILNTVYVLYQFLGNLDKKNRQLRLNHKQLNSRALYLTPLQTNKHIQLTIENKPKRKNSSWKKYFQWDSEVTQSAASRQSCQTETLLCKPQVTAVITITWSPQPCSLLMIVIKWKMKKLVFEIWHSLDC